MTGAAANSIEPRLTDLDRAGMAELAASLGEPAFRSKQVRRWIYEKGVLDPEEMSDLPAAFRERLAARRSPPPLAIESVATSADGTEKLLFRLHDGRYVESVLIPARERTTVCLSSQVGCAVRCHFCASGVDGAKRNLAPGEIVEQFILSRRRAEECGRRLTNLVMMGMGEPMHNYENVFAALDSIHADDGAGFGARRITVSTVGIAEGVDRFTAANTRYTLAFSLHAPNDEIRREIVPLKSAMPVAAIRAAALRYLEMTGREVTFEYVLLGGKNDRLEHARELAALLRGVQSTVNLIPWNPVPDLPFSRPGDQAVESFARELEARGVKVSLRRRKGADIAAACGQLALKAARGGSGS